jgi:hypothetical protein
MVDAPCPKISGMRGGCRQLAMLCVLLLAVVALAGCGDSSGVEDSTAEAKEARLFPWLKGPTREFLVPGGDNAVQMFGREATKAEREQASRTIAAWMGARAERNWKKDCSYFSRTFVKELTADAHGVTNGRVKTCPQALAYFKKAASGTYVNTMGEPIASLRVGVWEGQEDQGYAQYHGNDGKDWIVAVEREGGKWLVAKAAPMNRNR